MVAKPPDTQLDRHALGFQNGTNESRGELTGLQRPANPSPQSDSQEYMITYNKFKVISSLIMVALLPTLGYSHPFLDQLDLFSGLLNHLRS